MNGPLLYNNFWPEKGHRKWLFKSVFRATTLNYRLIMSPALTSKNDWWKIGVCVHIKIFFQLGYDLTKQKQSVYKYITWRQSVSIGLYNILTIAMLNIFKKTLNLFALYIISRHWEGTDVLLIEGNDVFKLHSSLKQKMALQWCHNGRDGVSNHRRFDCLLYRLFGSRSKQTSKLRATGLCEGNSPVTGEFPA